MTEPTPHAWAIRDGSCVACGGPVSRWGSDPGGAEHTKACGICALIADLDRAEAKVKEEALAAHVDACEKWEYLLTGPTPAPEEDIGRCGRDGWYCDKAPVPVSRRERMTDTLDLARALVAAASPETRDCDHDIRHGDCNSCDAWWPAALVAKGTLARLGFSPVNLDGVKSWLEILEALVGMLAYAEQLELLVYPETDEGVHDDVARGLAALAHAAKELEAD